MSKYILFIGARRSGKTHRAIEEARRVGPRVLVIAPTVVLAESVAQRYRVVTACCDGIPTGAPDAVVLDDVHRMSVKAVLSSLAAAIDRDAPIWATANPPTTSEEQQAIDALSAAGFVSVDCDEPAPAPDRTRFAAIAKVLNSREPSAIDGLAVAFRDLPREAR